jgi:hypothetical protein
MKLLLSRNGEVAVDDHIIMAITAFWCDSPEDPLTKYMSLINNTSRQVLSKTSPENSVGGVWILSVFF